MFLVLHQDSSITPEDQCIQVKVNLFFDGLSITVTATFIQASWTECVFAWQFNVRPKIQTIQTFCGQLSLTDTKNKLSDYIQIHFYNVKSSQ